MLLQSDPFSAEVLSIIVGMENDQYWHEGWASLKIQAIARDSNTNSSYNAGVQLK